MDTILNFFVQHKFNTVRIPVSVAFALSDKDTKPNPKFVSKDLRGLSIWQILDKAIDQCALRGLMVMLDMHTLGPQESTDLWVRKKRGAHPRAFFFCFFVCASWDCRSACLPACSIRL